MTQVLEQWRPLQPEDGYNYKGLGESFIQKLEDGDSLLYLNEVEKEQCTGCLTNYFLRHEMGEEDLTLIVQMVEGKLALHNFGEVNNAYLVTENLPDYLSAVAGELDTLLPYFKEIPAKNEYFENEIRVLRRIHSLSDRLKQGKLDDIDTRAIFWGLQEL